MRAKPRESSPPAMAAKSRGRRATRGDESLEGRCHAASRAWRAPTEMRSALGGEAGEVFVLQAHVVAGAVDQAFDLGVAEFAHPAGRAADPQFALADRLARRNQRTGADEGVLAHHRAIHHQRAHADQGAVADAAGVYDGLVPDGDVLADDRGIAVQPRVRASVADVDDAAVLDVRARTDADVVDVAAHHCAGPDGDVVAQGDVADDDGGRINVDALA